MAIRGVVALGALAVLAACGETAPSLTEGDAIEGTWRLSSFSTSAGELDDAELVMEIDLGAASISADTICHTVLGSFSVDDDGALSFTIPGTTNQPCDDDQQALEDEIVEGLEAVTTWRRQGDQLTLAGPDQLVLEFRQAG